MKTYFKGLLLGLCIVLQGATHANRYEFTQIAKAGVRATVLGCGLYGLHAVLKPYWPLGAQVLTIAAGIGAAAWYTHSLFASRTQHKQVSVRKRAPVTEPVVLEQQELVLKKIKDHGFFWSEECNAFVAQYKCRRARLWFVKKSQEWLLLYEVAEKRACTSISQNIDAVLACWKTCKELV